MLKAFLVVLVIASICVVSNAQNGTAGGGQGTCDPAEISGPQYDVTCPDGENNPVNVSQVCVVKCKGGLTGEVRDRTCLFRNTPLWGGTNPDCKDGINACESFPCGINATCHDSPYPAGNNSAGRTCKCGFGFFGDAEVLCKLNSSVPCSGNLWSPTGYAPCEPCRSCQNGITATAPCTSTSNTQCPPRVDCGYIQGDPHFQSLDGAYYDYQGAGEFYALRGINDPTINIQVKFIPCSYGVTCMEGLSMTIGNTNMSVTYVSNTPPRTLRWFQNNVDVTSSLPLTINGVVFAVGNAQYGATQYLITDNAHGISITVNDWYYIACTICTTSALYDQITGLMGRYDGNPSNDAPQGYGFATFSSNGFRVLDEGSEGWRVPESESNTHYGFNQSYASINDPDFPAITFDDDFVPSPAAEAACANRGLDKQFLDSCLQDVTSTNNVAFAAAAQGFSQLVTDLNNQNNGNHSSALATAVSSLALVLVLILTVSLMA